MAKTVRIALAQYNATVGDLTGNRNKVLGGIEQAARAQADLVVFPELFLCGYPPEDLLHRPRFLRDVRQSLESIAPQVGSTGVLVGWPESTERGVYNAMACLKDGRLAANYRKGVLPNYGVFDEKRYFLSETLPVVIEQSGIRLALTICEDLWDLPWLDRFYKDNGVTFDCLVNISASPFHVGKIRHRREVIQRCARHFRTPIIYCNLVGGQDELVFDGRSLVIDAEGRPVLCARSFEEDFTVFDLGAGEGGPVRIKPGAVVPDVPEEFDPITEVWQALVLGTRDYVRKNGFAKVLIGLSGGIDSALTAAIACEALGPENVMGLSMPTRFNSAETRSDAERLAENLAIRFATLPISSTLDSFSRTLSAIDGWNEKGLAYENLQARIRGTILMSLSNQFGYLVLTTGNKSETAVGYSTLYGDTAGGFAVIKDVPKTMVYQLCDYYNRIKGGPAIPESIIHRIPSAELRENQKDSDSLPDYDTLDRILRGYIEQERGIDELIAEGLGRGDVERVYRLVDRSEYKRRQCPPGIKITPRAFGKDRRMPITNRYSS